MCNTIYYIVGGSLASISIPALAQDAPMQDAALVVAESSAALSAEQQASYDGWPAEQQAQFDTWPGEVQTYFLTLTPERQSLFWRISDANKVTLAGLSAEQQAQA